jgi:excisionase family DNA binding protein
MGNTPLACPARPPTAPDNSRFNPISVELLDAIEDAVKRALRGSSPAPLAYSIHELGATVGLGKQAIYDAINSGELPARKAGRRTLILAADAERWLANLPAFPPARAAPNHPDVTPGMAPRPDPVGRISLKTSDLAEQQDRGPRNSWARRVGPRR